MPVLPITRSAPKERPAEFELNVDSPLARGLVFAGLGRHPGTDHYHDSSPYKRHGTLLEMNPATDWVWVPELERYGVNFSVLSAPQKSINMGSQLVPNANDFTVAIWVKPEADGAYIWSDWNSNGGHVLWRPLSTDNLSYLVNSTALITITDFFTTYTGWAHITVRRDAISSDIYINGEYAQGADNVAVTNTSHSFILGNRSALNRQWLGVISEPSVWHRALTPSEIVTLADPSNHELIRPVSKQYHILPAETPQPTALRVIPVKKAAPKERPMPTPQRFRPNPDSIQSHGLVGWFPLNTQDFRIYGQYGAEDVMQGAYRASFFKYQDGGNPYGYKSRDNSYAPYFDLANKQYVELGASAKYSFAEKPFSVAAWLRIVNAYDGGARAIVSKLQDSTVFAGEWELSIGGNEASNFALYNGTGITDRIRFQGTQSLPWNETIHLVGTYDGSGSHTGLQVYFNGEPDTGSTNQQGTYTGMQEDISNLFLGARSPEGGALEAYAGHIILDVRIYNRELSAGEVEHLYNPRSRWELYEPTSKSYFITPAETPQPGLILTPGVTSAPATVEGLPTETGLILDLDYT